MKGQPLSKQFPGIEQAVREGHARQEPAALTAKRVGGGCRAQHVYAARRALGLRYPDPHQVNKHLRSTWNRPLRTPRAAQA